MCESRISNIHVLFKLWSKEEFVAKIKVYKILIKY